MTSVSAKRVTLSVLMLGMMLSACATAKKGAHVVASGTENVVHGTGYAIGSLIPGWKASLDQQQEQTPEEAENFTAPAIEGDSMTQSGAEPSLVTRAEQKRRVKDGPETIRKIRLNPFKIYPFKRKIVEGDASDNQKLRERAWAALVDRTEVRLIGDDRVRIDVHSPIVMDVQEMEYLLLGRAAGEAARAGYPRFSIVFLKYSGGSGLAGMFLPEMSLATQGWIGNYEELISERESQRMMSNIGRFGGKNIEAVIRFSDGNERRGRDTFPATEVYLNMLNENLYDGDYPYKN